MIINNILNLNWDDKTKISKLRKSHKDAMAIFNKKADKYIEIERSIKKFKLTREENQHTFNEYERYEKELNEQDLFLTKLENTIKHIKSGM